MKKKLGRKLTLSRETLRHLDDSALGDVNGASLVETDCANCANSGPTGICGTCSCTAMSCVIPCKACAIDPETVAEQ